MNAKEARDKAYKFNTSTANSQYAEIKKLIDKNCSIGGYEFWTDMSIKSDVVKKLQDEGYEITYNSHRNEESYKIKW